MTRDRKCRDSAAGLPGGLSIDSAIEATAPDCVIRGSQPASHVVEIRNRTLLRFEVHIAAQSGSERVSYAGNMSTWEAKVQVNKRPPSGGPSKRKVSQPLECSEEATDESIAVVIKYEAIGCRCTGSTEMQLLVDTRP